jgi:DNA repair protein RadC
LKGKEKMHPKHYKRMAKVQWSTVEEKLCELGPASLSNNEILSLLITPGIHDRSAEEIAADILEEFRNYEGLADQPLEKFLKIKGMGRNKVVRLAAAMEFAKRWVDMAVKKLKYDHELHREVFGAL